MQIEQIHTNPDPYAPYLLSQAIRVGGFLFVSGQAGVGDDGSIVSRGDFDGQADQAFRNLERALKAGGSGMDQVAKVTIYLTSMAHFPQIVEPAAQVVLGTVPGRHTREVAALYSPDAMIEIEAVGITAEQSG